MPAVRFLLADAEDARRAIQAAKRALTGQLIVIDGGNSVVEDKGQ
jgi:hypothetical protein